MATVYDIQMDRTSATGSLDDYILDVREAERTFSASTSKAASSSGNSSQRGDVIWEPGNAWRENFS